MIRGLLLLAVISLAVELAVQAYWWRHAGNLDEVAAQYKAALLARAISGGLNAAAFELAFLVVLMFALGVLAFGAPARAPAGAADPPVAEPEPPLWNVVSGTLARLPDDSDPEDSRRVIDATTALAGGEPEAVRWVAFHAARLSHCDRAVELIEGLGAAITDDDQLSIAYYSFLHGDTRRGLAALDRVDPGELDGRGRLYYHLNRAALTLDAEPTPATADRATADLAEVRKLLDKVAHRIRREELDGLLAAERIGHGRIDLARGSWASAIDNLRQAIDRYDDRRPFIYVLLGDAHAAAGEREPAEAAWKRAIELGPDGSHHVGQARDRLAATPYR